MLRSQVQTRTFRALAQLHIHSPARPGAGGAAAVGIIITGMTESDHHGAFASCPCATRPPSGSSTFPRSTSCPAAGGRRRLRACLRHRRRSRRRHAGVGPPLRSRRVRRGPRARGAAGPGAPRDLRRDQRARRRRSSPMRRRGSRSPSTGPTRSVIDGALSAAAASAGRAGPGARRPAMAGLLRHGPRLGTEAARPACGRSRRAGRARLRGDRRGRDRRGASPAI